MKFPVYLTIDLFLILATVPALIMLWKRIDSLYKQAVAFSLVFMIALSSFCQYVSLIHVRAWRVDPETTYILPFHLGGAPIEEYMFWWFFGLLMIELYMWPKLWFDKMDRERKKTTEGTENGG